MRPKDEGDSGVVFQQITGSFIDGPGIRTTVFLKGCPLHCLWCCNPEGQSLNAELKFTKSKCNACVKCLKTCPQDAISRQSTSPDDKVTIDRKLCTNCLKCVDICPTGALEVYGKCMTVEELFETIKKHEQFFRTSGGGVTIGGGEPTMQAKFLRRFLKKCKENYIHTSLDTCGYTENEESARALEEADILLFDIKGMDDAKHKRITGVSNKVILQNIERMDAMGKPIIIRMPLIHGYNDSREDITSAGKFMSKLKNLQRVDLLGYHEFGKVKYDHLGKPYKVKARQLSNEELEEIRHTLEGYGLKVQLGG